MVSAMCDQRFFRVMYKQQWQRLSWDRMLVVIFDLVQLPQHFIFPTQCFSCFCPVKLCENLINAQYAGTDSEPSLSHTFRLSDWRFCFLDPVVPMRSSALLHRLFGKMVHWTPYPNQKDDSDFLHYSVASGHFLFYLFFLHQYNCIYRLLFILFALER